MRLSNDAKGPLLGVLIAGAAFAAVLVYGAKRAAAAPAPFPPLPKLEPVGFLPGLKAGDTVVVDTAAANIPPPSNVVPLLVCTVDGLLSDPVLVSVRAVGAPFGGTIPRAAIVKVLPPVAPGVFA